MKKVPATRRRQEPPDAAPAARRPLAAARSSGPQRAAADCASTRSSQTCRPSPSTTRRAKGRRLAGLRRWRGLEGEGRGGERGTGGAIVADGTLGAALLHALGLGDGSEQLLAALARLPRPAHHVGARDHLARLLPHLPPHIPLLSTHHPPPPTACRSQARHCKPTEPATIKAGRQRGAWHVAAARLAAARANSTHPDHAPRHAHLRAAPRGYAQRGGRRCP